MKEEYLIPVLFIWDSVEKIDCEKLPNLIVLKCTHESGGVITCKDKQHFDIKNLKIKLIMHTEINYYYSGRERAYKNVETRIIAENLMVVESGFEFEDYKFFYLTSKPKMLQMDFDL